MCFITVAGFLNGPGFQKMRADLRRDADEVWVIDCSPEGHQPAVNTRVFEGVQQPVCIVIASRRNEARPGEAARVRFRQLPLGHRTHKFKAIAQISLDDTGWQEASREWRASFFPESEDHWKSYPTLWSLFEADYPGCKANRTWPIAPDKVSLEHRWQTLLAEKNLEAKADLFKETRDRTLIRTPSDGVAGHEFRLSSISEDQGPIVPPVRYAFRTFDRQYIIPDKRLIDFERPPLWTQYSARQCFLTGLTAPHDRSPESGPALSVTALIPDMHHYHGRGGRAVPLWADAAATQPNVRQALLSELSILYGPREVSAKDVFAYIAAVAAHPGYTSRFAKDLAQPGLRIPITADVTLFDEAAALGREVVWLHTFGERFADPGEGRPASPPRIENGPTISAGGAIPLMPEKVPDAMRYDPNAQRLYVGEGYIDRVPPAVWAYEVSGMHVLKQWFSYRKKDRSRPIIGDRRAPSPLGDIQPDRWLPEYTSELINVLHVLARLVALEPAQADLLRRIVEGATHSVEKLGDALRKQP